MGADCRRGDFERRDALRWRPRDKNDQDAASLETFTILTTDPNQLMEPVHNRMSVILEPKDYERWFDPGDPARPPVDLLRPYPAERMTAWSVSDRVGNVRNDEPALLEPIERANVRDE